MTTDRPARTWPLLLLALPAFVAIWSGWVGLGERTGFGVVKPFPGIPGLDRVTLNTAITLPIGVETYAAYALRVWLSGGVNERARAFARWSAVASLILGGAGQVAYHLMVVGRFDPVTIVVSCLPVAVLGMGVGLAHLLNAGPEQDTQTPAPVVQHLAPEPAPLARDTLASVTAITAHRVTPAAERPAVVSAPVPEQIEAPKPEPKSRARSSANREQALEMRAAGLKNAEIARRLGVTPQTVGGYFKD